MTMTDDPKITELLAPLHRLEPVPFSGREARNRRKLGKPVVVAVVAGLALALAGVAIADRFGAFRGISSAYGPQTPAALKWAKGFQAQCKTLPKAVRQAGVYYAPCHVILSSARLLAPGSHVYVVTDTRGDLCTTLGFGGGCGKPLSAKVPITLGAANTGPIPPGGTLTVGGVALDGVKSVSFHIWNHPITVPVKHNVWSYTRRHSSATGARCVVVHMDDGSTLRPFPEVPCP
jgi:hypothetical protein